MKRHGLLILGVSALFLFSSCSQEQQPSKVETPSVLRPVESNTPTETADAFVMRVNDEIRALYPLVSSAQWLSSTYINVDSQRVAAETNALWLSRLNQWIEQSKEYAEADLSSETSRMLHLLKLMSAMPAPKDPDQLAELTQIAARMEGMYGAGRYCEQEDRPESCRHLGDLEEILRSNRNHDELMAAWEGWHETARPMREAFIRFVELANTGAHELGYADVGELWRSGYDAPPETLQVETDRLWEQVKPLYEQLHCYARGKLDDTYGQSRVQREGGLIAAHLLGNMWQQDWGNLWDILQPYEKADALDITGALKRQFQRNYSEEINRIGGAQATAAQLFQADRAAMARTARQMNQRAQEFYTSLGMLELPESYWHNSQFIKPLDREVVCHASAWDMDMSGDVRIKMCTEPTEEEFMTIYHELGHIYYYLAYQPQPPLFQNGANDGFHEAIGDTIVLSMTPEYLHSIGLVDRPQQSEEALINAQMRMALSKIAFLPFGLMIDRWRWGVFDGSIPPDQYNRAWWTLKAQYQGVAPPSQRDETHFDPGAKYHVPGNVPYLRYFLAHILQFQFYKSLCDAAGHEGPLHTCSFYGNEDAGRKFWAMLQAGNSRPWQETLKAMTGSDRIDAAALLEYFAPLETWLKAQNANAECGWTPESSMTEAPSLESKTATETPSETPDTSRNATTTPSTSEAAEQPESDPIRAVHFGKAGVDAGLFFTLAS